MSNNKHFYKCECVENIFNKVVEINKLEGVEDIYLEPVSFDGDTTSTIFIKFEGKKKPKEFQFAHKYCPFCGKKILNKEGE